MNPNTNTNMSTNTNTNMNTNTNTNIRSVSKQDNNPNLCALSPKTLRLRGRQENPREPADHGSFRV